MKYVKRARPAIAALCGAAILGCGGGMPGAPDGLDSSSAALESSADRRPSNTLSAPNPSGTALTYSTRGPISTDNAFFRELGTNGRACIHCHTPTDGWTIVPANLKQRFDSTGGRDPVFRLVDGANSPRANVSTVDARRRAYSMLLNKGLIRVGIGIPASAEFDLVAVDDPYGYATASELSLFRRPLPSANLRFLSSLMWDGRESPAGTSIEQGLSQQAHDATMGHAEAQVPPTAEQRQEIVAFESALYIAQVDDKAAGDLRTSGANGGPLALSRQPFYLGINDPLGGNPTGAPFDPKAFNLYNAWSTRSGSGGSGARSAVARGQALFNSRTFTVSGVRGLNDALRQPSIPATCTLCHDAPNAGDHSVPLPLDLGLSDASRRTPDMPLYTLRNKATGELYKTTDPGRALITGKWADRGKFKGPVLRGAASRAPYFHDGSVATLEAVVQFYDQRFRIGLSKSEKADLAAFLKTL